MKNFFLFVLLTISTGSFATNKVVTTSVKSQILLETEGISLIAKTDIYGSTSYNVVATVATKLIPKAVESLCLITFKNKTACSAVFAVSEALVSAKENSIKQGVTQAIAWVANKGSFSGGSSAKTTTIDRPTAEAIYYTFVEYKRISCVQWGSVKSEGSVQSVNVKSPTCASKGLNSQLFAIIKTKDATLNLRALASQTSEVLYLMPRGARVVVLGFDNKITVLRDGRRARWVKVRYTDLEFNKTYQGWAWESYLQIEKN